MQRPSGFIVSEVEFYALSEAAKEMPYMMQMLQFMGVKVKNLVDAKSRQYGRITEAL